MSTRPCPRGNCSTLVILTRQFNQKTVMTGWSALTGPLNNTLDIPNRRVKMEGYNFLPDLLQSMKHAIGIITRHINQHMIWELQ